MLAAECRIIVLFKGIGLVTLLWTDGNKILPVDFRIHNFGEDEKTKNDHFLDMLDKAEERGFKPKFVIFIYGMQA